MYVIGKYDECAHSGERETGNGLFPFNISPSFFSLLFCQTCMDELICWDIIFEEAPLPLPSPTTRCAFVSMFARLLQVASQRSDDTIMTRGPSSRQGTGGGGGLGGGGSETKLTAEVLKAYQNTKQQIIN